MQRRGCVGNQRTFCGSYNNYPFTVVYGSGKSGGKTQFQIQMQFNSKLKNSFVRDLNKRLPKEYRVARLQSNDQNLLYLSVTTRNNEELEQAVDAILEQATNLATENALGVPVLCPLCRSDSCDSYAYWKESYRPVHAACVQNSTSATQYKAQNSIVKGNYLTGLIGAILGAIVGSIPTILLLAANWIIAVACALIPLGAYYGYKLFRGKMNKAVLAFVLPVSLLMIPVIDYINSAMVLFAEYGEWLSAGLYIELLMAYPEEFAPFMLQLLLFVGIGIFIVWGQISRTSHDVIIDSTFTAATLRPNGNYQAPAAVPVQQAVPAAAYPSMAAQPAPRDEGPKTGIGISD